ncbi:MAG: hypothetical protein KDK51_06985 [Deltaproteobacteria bacterium]|nr:hypothetical protein [Deltaproteobacteria bacterium]
MSPWMPGMEYIVAVISRLIGVTELKDIAAISILIVPLLALPLIWCIKPIVSKYTSAITVRSIVYFSFILLPSIVLVTSLGRFDHHVFEATQIVMMMCLYYAEIKSVKKIIAWTVFFCGSWFMWPHAWMLSGLLMPLVLYEQNKQEIHILVKAFGCSFFVQSLMLFLLAPDAFLSGNISIFGISWWTPIVCLLSSAFLSDSIRVFDQDKKNIRHRMPIYMPGILVFVTFVFKDRVWRLCKSLYFGITADRGTLANTLETMSAFSKAQKVGFDNDTTLALLVPLMFLFLWRYKNYRSFLVYVFIPFTLFLFQVRFMSMLFPLFALLTAFFLYELSKLPWIQKKIKANWMRQMLFLVLVCVFYFPIHKKLGKAYPNNYRYFQHVKRASQFLHIESQRLGFDPKTAGVASRWMFGHWILMYAGMPVVATPFQGQSALDYSEFLYGIGEEGVTSFLDKYPVRYLLMINAPHEHMNQFLFYHPDQPNVIELQGETMVVKDGFKELRSSQFLFKNAIPYINNVHGPWRVVYASEQKLEHMNNYSDVKVFERVQGAKLLLETARNDLVAHAVVYIAPREEVVLELTPQRVGNTLVWKVPYGQYHAMGVQFSGEYIIKAKDNSVLGSFMVNEEDVLLGHQIQMVENRR